MSDIKEKHLETLSEIRSLMEQSSKFISLSGLSGISAGIIALLGAVAAWMSDTPARYSPDYGTGGQFQPRYVDINFYLWDAAIVMILALALGIFFTTRKAHRQGLPVWDGTAKRLVLNLFIPVAVGGLFCLIMLAHGEIQHIAGATLIFYGLGLINAGKYTLSEVRWLGGAEIVLGLLAALFPGYGLLFWALGFGVLHILYGSMMYFKYER